MNWIQLVLGVSAIVLMWSFIAIIWYTIWTDWKEGENQGADPSR